MFAWQNSSIKEDGVANNDSFSFYFKAREKNMLFYGERVLCSEMNTLFYVLYERRDLMLEARFKTRLSNKLKQMFPGCIVLHTDPTDIQGLPDLVILYNNRWAGLEGKKEATSSHRPNQDYYVDLMNKMSFARFISPENEGDVLDELQRSFED